MAENKLIVDDLYVIITTILLEHANSMDLSSTQGVERYRRHVDSATQMIKSLMQIFNDQITDGIKSQLFDILGDLVIDLGRPVQAYASYITFA